MDSEHRRQQHSAGTKGRKVKLLVAAAGGIIVLLGLVALIAWLALRPQKPKYYLESGSVSQFQISKVGLVNSRVSFKITTRNPNKRVAIYYDKIDAFLLYDGQEIAWSSIAPFFQGHKNTTSLHTALSGYFVPLDAGSSRDLKLEHSSGNVDVDLTLYARIRFKRGSFKSKHYTLRVKCRHVTLDGAAKGGTAGSFKPMKCHVHV